MPIPLWLYLNQITNYYWSASVRVSVRQCECAGVSHSHYHITMMIRTHKVRQFLLAQELTTLKLKFIKNESDCIISFLFFSFSLVVLFIFAFFFIICYYLVLVLVFINDINIFSFLHF